MSYWSISGVTWDILSQKISKLKGFFLFCLVVLEWLWLKDFYMPQRKRAYIMWRPSPHHSINYIAYTIVPFYGLTKCKFWHSWDFYRLLVVSIRLSNFQDNMTQIRDKKILLPNWWSFSVEWVLSFMTRSLCDRSSCHTQAAYQVVWTETLLDRHSTILYQPNRCGSGKSGYSEKSGRGWL